MKFRILIISVLTFFTLSASAQYKEYTFGVKIGPSWTWMTSTDATTLNHQTMTSFNFGVLVEKHFSEKFSLVTGITFDNYRGDYSFADKRSSHEFMPEQAVYVNRQYKGMYLNIPVLAKLKVAEIGAFSPYVQGGVNLSYRISAKAKDKYDVGVYHYEDASFRDVRSEFMSFNASFNLGVGTEFEISPKLKAFAQVIYNRSIFDLTSIKYHKDGGPRIYGNYIALELGIIL